MRPMLIAAMLGLSTGAAPCRAAPPALEDLDLLDARIAAFVGAAVAGGGAVAQQVDRRLRLLRCAEAVVLEPPVLGAVAASCPSRGWRLRIPLAGGPTPVAALPVVRRGDAVDLAYQGAGFEVRTTAIAVEDGRAGGAVRVKSPTGTAITARVRGPGAVVIDD